MGSSRRGTRPIARVYIGGPQRKTVVLRTQGISEGTVRLIRIGAAESLELSLVLNYDDFVVKAPGQDPCPDSGLEPIRF